MHDGQMALVPYRLQSRHRRVEAEKAVQVNYRVTRDIDGWPHGVISLLAVRNHDIEAVGRAPLEDDHEAFVGGSRFDCAQRGTRQEVRQSRGPDHGHAAPS